MIMDFKEATRILESKSKIEEVIKEIRIIFRDKKDVAATLENILTKLKNHNACDITREIRFLIKQLGKDLMSTLTSIFSVAKKELGELLFYVVNKETLPNAWKVKSSEGLESLKVYITKKTIPRLLSFIVIRKSFLDKLIATRKIFSEIFETDADWIIATLATDNVNEIWPKLETTFIREKTSRMALDEFLPIMHAAVYIRDKEEAILFLEDMIRRLGLAARSWKRSVVCEKRIEELIKIGSQHDRLQLLIKGLYLLASRNAALQDICSLIMATLPIDSDHKKILIMANGCVPNEDFINMIQDEINISEATYTLAKILMDAEKIWAPEVSLAELFGISWLTYINSRVLREWLEEKLNMIALSLEKSEHVMPEELLDILKIALVIAISRVKCKHDDCVLIVRMLYSVRKRFIEYPIVLLSYIVEALRHFSHDKFSIAIYLQRILEIHGPMHYLFLLDKIFTRDEQKYVIALESIIASRLGIIARKAISLAMKNEDALRKINEVISTSNFKPHGITAPLHWELAFPITSKLKEMVKLAKQYVEDCGVEPSPLLKLLHELLELYPRVTEIKEIIKRGDLEELKEGYISLSQFRAILEMIRRLLRKIYGSEENPLVNKARVLISNYAGILNDTWERILVEKYSNLISNGGKIKLVYEVPEYIKKYVVSGSPVILLVIDGLRIDDYLIKLRDVLLGRGFVLKEEMSMLSLLPSITTISRRAIFGGKDVLRVFIPIPRAKEYKTYREEDFFKEKIDPQATYLHGAIRHVCNVLSRIGREGEGARVTAIVLSELEKAAHGATEGFLAKISMEYAMEVGRLAELAAKVIKGKFGKNPILFLASDHGLGLFTKVTETNIKTVISKLKQRGFLDPAYEPHVVERYAIIPLISKDLASSAKSLLDVQFKGEIHTVIASSLGFERVIMKIKGQDLFDQVPAERVLILFPRGRRRFVTEQRRIQRVVLHGGLLPVETIVPFAIFEYVE